MPSFSPNETQANLLGLSPNSFKAFQQREETRFNTLSQEFEDVLEEQDNVTDDDSGRDTEDEDNDAEENNDPWCNSDEEIYFSSSLDEERIQNDMGEWKSNDEINNYKIANRQISEEELIFPIEELLACGKNQNAKERANPPSKVEPSKTPPFWYENESPEHASKIIQYYTKEILHEDNICPKLRDCRRLPKFIGRIQRIPIKGGTKCLKNQSFVTFDKIDVFQRDIRQCGSYNTKLNTFYTISTWDNDGMPQILEKLESEDVCRWRRKAIKGFPISYIYSLPVWQSRTEFIYSVESEEHEVGYANQPWNYTSYLPKELLKNNLEELTYQ